MKHLLFLFLFVCSNGFSQDHISKQIIIKVVDSGDHQSISDAHVNVYSTSGSMEEFKSDSNGMVIYLVGSGNKYKVEAHKEGFLANSEGFSMEIISDTLTLAL